mmetsp:Transcript_28299/g.28593  ORF Transcript_28299/g.28593 Transcript_28299/m.28593 type:complete len:149 (-) Transcript_28299:39-485(-)|eukprot:CAMPEP_0182446614 /NCGR_PEP_ID=MMETSP1172-20130603/4308_1 /TAXON_ID=708627 /ORGANISM="Timspurckia oligopyrenoides, Strain CCMP3278" /LENGTH=148 /DNA_ID=CAMNT_0024642567 /DNA_START=58 /DNA_END=504 /DNA_ORIENTATION=-
MDSLETVRGGCTVKDVPAADFIAAYAAHLKKVGAIEVPKYVDYVKTGPRKELAPYDPDWYYVRVASLARRVYCRGGSGVGAYAKVYGGTKDNGSAPCHFKRASRSIIRHALQQLEKIGVVEQDANGGRRISRKGQAEMDTQASSLLTN